MTIKLVKFTAKWCPPCKVIAPTIKEFLAEHPDVTYEEINVDLPKNEARCDAENVRSIPTMIMYVDDKKVWKATSVVGARAFKNAYAKAKGGTP
jgi:thioredoxin 1